MNRVLLTGVTGFVGKVVLQDLLRRKKELGIDRVRVLIRTAKTRNGKTRSPLQRFQESVATAEVFSLLEKDWERHVEVVAGELAEARCGLSAEDYETVTRDTTQVIHCAASVEFDLPVKDAAAANITTALEVLELARACGKLERMVDVSTAYVSAWHAGEIKETLAHLPRAASEYLGAISDGSRTEAEMLAETGHPNTYTFTKCITEHLLFERCGAVSVSIVRPSIVSASWQTPFPGWLDSPAALAGCLLYTGLGLVRAFNADPAVRLDVVPVDVTAKIILDAAFFEPRPIRYAVMGIENALRVDMAALSTIAFFRERPGSKAVPGMFIGIEAHGFENADRWRRGLRLQLLRAMLFASGRDRERRQLEKVDEKVRYLNKAFSYFTHHTFDFRPETPAVPTGYDPVAYMDAVNAGLYRHILKLDEREMPLAGLGHDDARSDMGWMREKAVGSWPMEALALGMRKALRSCTSAVTFDRPSFERAVSNAPAEALFVLAPSHRSYFDFLLSSYLCFQHPELGIDVPHIAAAEEFGKIPLVGSVLRASRAFYIRRGVGKEVPELSEELRRIAGKKASVMFFIEGQRSRAREFLEPKRGLLRGLQATGQTFAILPLAIAYDRVPEEAALERELNGGRRSKMSLPALVKWVAQLARGNVQLGRVHISCGDPLRLDGKSDVRELADAVLASQQTLMAVSRFHLRSFLCEPGVMGIDEEWLVNAVKARGGRVIESELAPAIGASAVLRASLRNQWMHWFYSDALALYPHSEAVRAHVQKHGWVGVRASVVPRDPNVVRVVRALMAHIVEPTERPTAKPRRVVTASAQEALQ